MTAEPLSMVRAGQAVRLLDYLGPDLPDDRNDVYRDAVLAVADVFPELSPAEHAEIVGCVRAMTREWADAHRATTERVLFEDEALAGKELAGHRRLLWQQIENDQRPRGQPGSDAERF